jgi:hypothetical protein
MKKKLSLKILLFSLLFYSSIKSENFSVLTYEERMDLGKFLTKRSIKSGEQIYKFCFAITKSSNPKIRALKEKLKKHIVKNIEWSKSQMPKNIVKYCYETNPNSPEAQYIRRSVEINSVHLLGGSICRCCTPFDVLKQETYYILTGKELQPKDDLYKKDYEEFQQWEKSEKAKLEQKLHNLSN